MSRAESRRSAGLAAALLLAVGLSVRFTITSVSPLLHEIERGFGLSAAGLAALGAIPVLMFGLAAPLAPALVRAMGLERTLATLLAVLFLTTLLRPLGVGVLLIGTAVGGAAIAMLGVLAPQLIRDHLPSRPGFWSGIYTTAFGVSAATGAALAVPVFHALGSQIAPALAVWSAPIGAALILAVVAVFALRTRRPPSGSPLGARALLGSHGVWVVSGFFGCQALIYFSLTAWLPTIAADRGLAQGDAGLLLALLSLAGLPGSLLAPTLAMRARSRITVVVSVAALALLGLSGLALAPAVWLPLFVVALGAAQSSAFGLAIAFIVMLAPSPASTAGFSAVSQGVGYALAALGPLALGGLSQLGVSWGNTVWVLFLAGAAQLALGIVVARRSLAPRPPRAGEKPPRPLTP